MPAAALIGGGISAGGNILGSLIGSSAQTKAGNAARAQLQSMFDAVKGNAQPFIDAGKNTLGTLQDWINPSSGTNPLSSLIKLVTPGADQSATLAQTPGYQFTEGQGLRGVNNQLAARGLGGSPGAVAKGAANYVTGLASNTWQSVVDKLTNTFGTEGGMLQNLVNSGVAANSTLTGGAANFGSQIAGTQIGVGNAQAGAATGIGSAVGGLGNSYFTSNALAQLTGNNNSGGGLYNPGNPMYNANAPSYPNPQGGSWFSEAA